MMHDFICCEEVPSGGLTAAELETPLHTLLYGELYLSVHPEHLAAGTVTGKAAENNNNSTAVSSSPSSSSSSVQLQCKTHSTALDLLTSCGGAIATAPVKAGRNNATATAGVTPRAEADAVVLERRMKLAQAFKSVINIDTCAIR